MKRFLFALFALALLTANDAAVWANAVKDVCPGPCQLCP